MRYNRKYNPARHGKYCRYCHDDMTPETATFDHIVPKAQGGRDVWRNIIWCCSRCNSLKSDLSLEQFREKLSRITGMVMFAYEYSPLVDDELYDVWLNGATVTLKTTIGDLLKYR